MPRKKSAIPSATRIRENQRRSRARRNELINDLQQQLREYNSKEVQATLAMQVAARQLAWENAQLRVLLGRNGVLPGKINDFLRCQERPSVGHFEQQNDNVTQAPRDSHSEIADLARPTDQILHEPCRSEPDSGERRGGRSLEGQIRTDTSVSRLHKERSPSRSPTRDSRFGNLVRAPSSNTDECDGHAWNQPNAIDITQSSLLPTVSDCFCPDSPETSSGADTVLMMSCETAANIISNMRGNRDEERARLQLGCEIHERCEVETAKVFQIIEID